MRKTISICLCIALLFSILSLSVNATDVVLSSQNLTVNGRPVECEKYNIDGSNYFKLRDIAYLLNGTESQFDVGYDPDTRTVTVTSGLPYTPNGEELIVGMDKSETAQLSTQPIIINGVMDSSISAYNLAGYNYFKLRDLGDALGFFVDYDKPSNTAIILSAGYAPAPSAEPAPGTPAASPAELTAEQIYEKCSPGVFYIEVADSTGEVYATGSGFFISSDGTAVTNYHVINGAYAAKITLSSTKRQYDVVGVYDYNENEDWAILKIDGSGFPYLEIADASTVIGGAKCYAIGSPKGLQNTISDGIISNPAQELGDLSFIQISAAISRGSSGGALINKYGQVIGITSAGYEDGENLGFAIPISLIAGYSASRYSTLPELFSGVNAYDNLSAQDAFDCLVGFVKSSYTDVLSGDLVYAEEEVTSTGAVTRRIIYDASTDSLRIQRVEQYYDQEYWTTVTLRTDALIHTVLYSFYDDPYSQDPAFSAYIYVYAPGFNGDNLEFTEINVNTGYDVALNQTIASMDLQDTLLFADYVFYYYLSDYGDLGVYLFGFTDYYLNHAEYDSTAAEDAYSSLIAFIKENYNDQEDQTLIYSESADTSTGYVEYQLLYDLSEDRVGARRKELYSDQWYIITIFFEPDSYSHTVTYLYYLFEHSEEAAFRAHSDVYAPGFFGDNLEFTGVDMNLGFDVALNETIASSHLQYILYFTDIVLNTYISGDGDYGVDLFGFTNYDTGS